MMLYPIPEFNTKSAYKGSQFQVVGQDISNMEIEAVKVPFDGKYYWFEALEQGTMIRLAN